MFSYKVILIVFITIFCFGCATEQQIIKENEPEEVLFVSIEDNVILPDSYKYHGPGSAFGALIGGVLGALVAESGNDGPSVIKAYLDNNNLNIGKMYLNAFKKSVTSNKKLELTTDSDSDIKISLEIIKFGFDKGWGFSNVKPLIKVRAKMVRNNKTIWENTKSISGWTSSTAARPFKKWLEDAKLFEHDFNYSFSLLSDLQLRSY